MLHQPTTLWPLMGKFVAFAHIASRTSENDVTTIVGTTTANRDDMFNVIRCHLVAAIVALAFLSLVLYLYLLRGITSTCRTLAGASAMLTSSMTLFPTLGLLVMHPACSDRFRMLFFVSLRLSKQLIPIRLIVTCVVRLSRGISTVALDDAFLVFLIIPLPIAGMSISKDFILPISTDFTTSIKATSRASMEEIRRIREPLFTFTSALFLRKGRGIIHVLNRLLSSALFCRLPGEQGYSLFTQGNYSHAMQPSSKYTFFSAT